MSPSPQQRSFRFAVYDNGHGDPYLVKKQKMLSPNSSIYAASCPPKAQESLWNGGWESKKTLEPEEDDDHKEPVSIRHNRAIPHIQFQQLTEHTSSWMLKPDQISAWGGQVDRKSHPQMRSFRQFDSFWERESQLSLRVLSMSRLVRLHWKPHTHGVSCPKVSRPTKVWGPVTFPTSLSDWVKLWNHPALKRCSWFWGPLILLNW